MKVVPAQHIRHEPIDEVENISISNRKRPSPNVDPLAPSNPVEYGPEIKRPKPTNNVYRTYILSYFSRRQMCTISINATCSRMNGEFQCPVKEK